MKRRNADCGKLRRPIKRNKITEGMYGSTTVLYMKFLVLWAIVITADFMFMFRFEFLWPFWLLLRSVHDSFKYKGLAFSVLFVCIAITSDLVCLFFIPVHWLLFAASTYVWVQYVWHTDKGICLPTIILWMLFVYLEAGIRWKDSRHMPHLDLCRPFAAHCIGYPVVTLGFGFKSYVGYRIRQRKQREVARENEFYYDLIQAALPPEDPIVTAAVPATCNEIGASVSSQAPTTQMATTLVTATTTTTAATTTANSTHLCAQNSAQSSNANIFNMNVGGHLIGGLTNILPNGSANAVSSVITQNSHQNNHNHHQQQQQNHTSHQTSSNVPHHLLNGSSYHHSNHNSGSNSISANSNHGIATATIAASTNIITTATSNANSLLILSSSSATTPTFNDDNKRYETLNANNFNGGGGGIGNSNSSSNTAGGANGHVGGNLHSKAQRRNTEKEHKNRNGSTSSSSANETETKRKNHNNLQADNNSNNNNNHTTFDAKEKADVEQNISNAKDKQEHQRKSNVNSNSKANHNNNNDNHRSLQFEMDTVVAIEPVEKTKGRRNRSKKENAAAKDNQQHLNNNNNNNSNHHNTAKENGTSLSATQQHMNNNSRLHNSDASSVSSSISSASTTSLTSSATSTLSNIATKVVMKICESCLKFEADIKKYRSEISHMKQIENELRQKLESNLTNKSCLQAKQKECDELEKRVLELTNARHADFKASERRLTEERRQKQSLEAQLNNEKKARKLAEEKAARPECSLQCKQRKQQMEEELKHLRRDFKATEEAKLVVEQELRMFEAERRNRDSNQQPTEMLMNALAAMQDKNCTLEKNLSAETRVKLDLFSALGDAKRQLEISESRRRSKEDEVFDLKAKIAQLLAVMPLRDADTLCLPGCGSTSAGSMLRMNDTPPLNNVPGPASPMLTNLVNVNAQISSNVVPTSAVRVVQHQQQQQQQQPQQQSPSSPGDYAPQTPTDYCSGLVPVSVANSVLTVNANNGAPVPGASNLDPNASVYTPKTLQNCQGGVVIVGGGGNVSKGEA